MKIADEVKMGLMNRKSPYNCQRETSKYNYDGNYEGHHQHNDHIRNNKLPGGNNNNSKNYDNGGNSMFSKITTGNNNDGQ